MPSLLSGPRAAAYVAADTQVSALWFDDLKRQAPPPRRAPNTTHTTDRTATVLPSVTVREIRLPAPAAPVVPPGPPPWAAAARPPLAPSPFLPPPADRAARAAIKVARRAAVRHDKLASAPPLPAVSDVLVMDADAVARNHIDDLLGDFGFRVRPVATLGQATLLAGFHPFAAVLVAVPPGAIDGAVHDLFERVREIGRHAGVAAPVRVLVAAQWAPVDRVRAELAGCEATLVKPVSRRDLARVLDAHGVALPRDPRRV